MSRGLGLEGTGLYIRLNREIEVEMGLIRKDLHEASRLYDCLCISNLRRGGEESADKGGFGEHGEECLLLLCFQWMDGGSEDR